MTKSGLVAAFMAFMLLATMACAQDFDFTLTPIQSKIQPNETALFKLAIQNQATKIDQFYIYTPDVEWTFATQPSRDYVMKIYPNSVGETIVAVDSSMYTKPGLYGVTVTVKALSTEKTISKKVIVEIQSPKSAGQYLPTIYANTIFSEQIDPREPVKIRVELINQNILGLDDVEIVLSSQAIQKSYKTSLGPLERKTVDFTINLDSYLAPISDILRTTALVRQDGETHFFEGVPKRYEIISYGKLVRSEEPATGFLKRKSTIDLYNEGNDRKEYYLRIERHFFSAMFTSFDPKPNVLKLDDGKYYNWQFTLDSREHATIKASVNYWPLVIIAALIAAAVILYFMLRSPLVIYKSSQIISKRTGGIEVIAIQLDIINRGKKTLRNVHIIEKLPNLLDYHKEEKPGLVEPDTVLRHEKKGTILKWNLGSIEPYEERVITYKSISRLSILGGLSLPAAYANYEERRGQESATSSNVLYIKI